MYIYSSETSTQKHRNAKLTIGTRQRAAVQTARGTDTAKKGLKACQATPDKTSDHTQQETYRVCRLVWPSSSVFVKIQKFSKTVDVKSCVFCLCVFVYVKVILEERDQERERRWKAEQAVKKLTDQVKGLQTRATEEKELQNLAFHTTDR